MLCKIVVALDLADKRVIHRNILYVRQCANNPAASKNAYPYKISGKIYQN